jgi:hypothetical protein
MLDVCAKDDRFCASREPVAVGAAGMLMPPSGYDGIWEEANVLVGQEEFEVGSHVAQLHGEVLPLHRNGKDAFKVVDRAVAMQRRRH